MTKKRAKNKEKKVGALVCQTLGLSLIASQTMASYITTADIYRQAHAQNTAFFDRLSAYRNAVDTTDRNGDTAFCLAVDRGDVAAQRVLLRYGAQRDHPCMTNGAPQGQATTVKSSYIWGGLIGAVVVAGVVGMASGGGGGSSGSSDISTGSDTPSTDTPSTDESLPDPTIPTPIIPDPDPTPSEPDTDDSSGDNSGTNDSSSGDNSGTDTPSTDTPSTDDTETDNSTTDTPSTDENNTDSSGTDTTLQPVTASYFETTEYTNGGFLNKINASGAYAQMYNLDSSGNLVSHQAGSSDPLEKVTVGILDVGVYPNQDISGKIVYTQNSNTYQGASNSYGYIKDGCFYQIFKNTSGTYSLFIWKDNTDSWSWKSTGLTEAQLANELNGYGLTFSQFTLMNADQNGYPGASSSTVSSSDKEADFYNYAMELSHGTHVAGIIGASKNDSEMHGVAFENARFAVASWDMTLSTAPILIKNLFEAGAKVLNNSWGGTSGTYNASNYKQLQGSASGYKLYTIYMNTITYGNHDFVWVQATGNDSKSEPTIYAGLGQFKSSDYANLNKSTSSVTGKYEVPFVAVTALGTDGKIASWANKCGSTASYCITAPGSAITSTIAVDNGTWNMSGTSMATPVVSGSIALLRGYYPWLNTQNIAYLLLNTADNTGIYADSSVYGRGLLDLNAAVTTPIDGLSLATTSTFSALESVSSSKIRSSGVIQTVALQNMPSTITTFDALNRPFEYKTENLIETTHTSSARLKNELKALRTTFTDREIKTAHSGFTFRSGTQTVVKGGARLSDLEVSLRTDTDSLRLYYATQSRYADRTSVVEQNENPYFAMTEAYGAEKTFHFGDDSAFSFRLQTGQNGLFERDKEQDSYDFDHRSYALGMGYNYRLNERIRLDVMGGMLAEDDALLGVNGSGAFKLEDTQTYYTGAKVTINATDKTALNAAYYRGFTNAMKTPLWSTSSLATESFTLSGNYKPDRQTNFGLSFASPLAVIKGEARFRYAIGRDNYSDTIYFDEAKSSLKPSAREYDLSLYMQKTLPNRLEWTAKTAVRFNADSERGLMDYLGLVGLLYRF